jgi:hypothetical protein
MKKQTTKKLLAFILPVIIGMMFYGNAIAQHCDCNNIQVGCNYNTKCILRCSKICNGINRTIGKSVVFGETFLADISPNPVSNSMTISFSLSQSQKVSLKIFDMNERLVSTLADKMFEEGENQIAWQADEVNAGIYFLQFQSAENVQTEKLIVAK